MTFIHSLKLAAALALTASVLSPLLVGADTGERGEKRRGPPQEAFEACANSAEGSVCSFSGRRGDMQGTCVTPPRGDETLVCAPERGERGQRGERDSEQIQ